MIDDGWTRSYRRRWTNPVFRNLRDAGVWAWMTDAAAWRDTKVRFCERLIPIARGQLVTSERFVAEGFAVDRQVIRRLWDALEAEQMITRQRTHGGTIITICNYDAYQPVADDGNPSENPSQTHVQPTPNPNKEESKNLRKKSISRDGGSGSDPEFTEWYAAYPRKVDPGRAAKAYRAARSIASAADLLDGARRYAAECEGKDRQYVKHPASWLNAHSWKNEPTLKLVPKPGGERKPNAPAAGTPEWEQMMRDAGAM